MPQLNSQADIVHQFMLRQEEGNTVVDELRLPGLKERFISPPKASKIKTDAVKLPGLKELAGKSRMEIAELLMGTLNYRPGITGFNWKIGEDTLEVSYAEDFIQRQLETDVEKDELIELLAMVLKMRKDIKQLRWDFGEDYIEVTHTA